MERTTKEDLASYQNLSLSSITQIPDKYQLAASFNLFYSDIAVENLSGRLHNSAFLRKFIFTNLNDSYHEKHKDRSQEITGLHKIR